jgi:hypothetical protein
LRVRVDHVDVAKEEKMEHLTMTEEIIVLVAAIYASVAAIAYRRIGFLPAIVWPATIVCIGTIVFFVTILTPPNQDSEK